MSVNFESFNHVFRLKVVTDSLQGKPRARGSWQKKRPRQEEEDDKSWNQEGKLDMDHLGRKSFGHDGAILKDGERKAWAQTEKDLHAGPSTSKVGLALARIRSVKTQVPGLFWTSSVPFSK